MYGYLFFVYLCALYAYYHNKNRNFTKQCVLQRAVNVLGVVYLSTPLLKYPLPLAQKPLTRLK
jgi:hypothetical protein